MSPVLVVAPPGAWPVGWDLAPSRVRVVSKLEGDCLAPEVEAVVIVPGSADDVAAAVKCVEEARAGQPLALLLASRGRQPGVAELLERHEFDGFLDLDWLSATAKACVQLVLRGVADGKNVVDIQRVVLEQSRTEAASLYDLAAHDDLTGLYNRRHFLQILEREHERCLRQGRPYALAFIDLDDLKKLNSRYGHAGGSTALRELAGVLMTLLRASDIAGRLGGDEFLVFLADCDRSGALLFAERVLERLRNHRFHVAANKLSITASLGLAVYPDDGREAFEVVDRADEALLFAKTHGKDRVVTASLANGSTR